MNPIVRNILAVVAGVIVGGAVNMGIIMISGMIIAPPPGADMTTMEGVKAAMPMMEPRHFIMPFLAHALGTLAGSFVAAWLAASRRLVLAIVIGLWNMLGGAMAVMMLPAPMWFNVLDLVGAYIPFGYFGGRIGLMIRKEQPPA